MANRPCLPPERPLHLRLKSPSHSRLSFLDLFCPSLRNPVPLSAPIKISTLRLCVVNEESKISSIWTPLPREQGCRRNLRLSRGALRGKSISLVEFKRHRALTSPSSCQPQCARSPSFYSYFFESIVDQIRLLS